MNPKLSLSSFHSTQNDVSPDDIQINLQCPQHNRPYFGLNIQPNKINRLRCEKCFDLIGTLGFEQMIGELKKGNEEESNSIQNVYSQQLTLLQQISQQTKNLEVDIQKKIDDEKNKSQIIQCYRQSQRLDTLTDQEFQQIGNILAEKRTQSDQFEFNIAIRKPNLDSIQQLQHANEILNKIHIGITSQPKYSVSQIGDEHNKEKIHDSKIVSFAISDDGDKIVSGDLNGLLVLWNPEQKRRHVYKHYDESFKTIKLITFLKNGDICYYTQDNFLKILSIRNLSSVKYEYQAKVAANITKITSIIGHTEPQTIWIISNNRAIYKYNYIDQGYKYNWGNDSTVFLKISQNQELIIEVAKKNYVIFIKNEKDFGKCQFSNDYRIDELAISKSCEEFCTLDNTQAKIFIWDIAACKLRYNKNVPQQPKKFLCDKNYQEIPRTIYFINNDQCVLAYLQSQKILLVYDSQKSYPIQTKEINFTNDLLIVDPNEQFIIISGLSRFLSQNLIYQFPINYK